MDKTYLVRRRSEANIAIEVSSFFVFALEQRYKLCRRKAGDHRPLSSITSLLVVFYLLPTLVVDNIRKLGS